MGLRFAEDPAGNKPSKTRTGKYAAPASNAIYSKVKHLGAGAFGSVSLVKKNATGELMVMKEVQLKNLSAKELRRSQNEVEVLKRLSHPHLISYRESHAVRDKAVLAIMMEYADGGDLLALIENKAAAKERFSEREVLKILVQLSSALAYCHHELHLLHRDIKPANIFLTSGGDVKLGDFGISKSLAASAALATTKCGSPLYMSPELCTGRPYDRGADVWAVGCTLYHMMSHKEPWLDQVGSKGGMMLLMRLICTQALDLHVLRSHYSFELCGLMASLLNKSSKHRPSFKQILAEPFIKSAAATLRSTDGQPSPPASATGDNRVESPKASPPAPAPAPAAAPASTPEANGAAGAAPAADTPEEEEAHGTDAHAAAAVLQRSFQRRHPIGINPRGYSGAVQQQQRR